MLVSIFDSSTMTLSSLLIYIITSILLGLFISFINIKTTRCSRNFAISLAVLPLIVSSLIIMVNGNLGTSVAVLGAFSLIRYRSIPGNSKEITTVFYAMAVGVAIGMGQILFSIIVTIVVGLVLVCLNKVKFDKTSRKYLVVTIPEDLDYTNLFKDLFSKYLNSYELEKSRTTNMGSLFELTYNISLKSDVNEKEFIDEIRVRNGNLKIILTHNIEGDL